jgi:lipopolysaccharide/colanic/teichoic acid biosynthesis glycosyltransferase
MGEAILVDLDGGAAKIPLGRSQARAMDWDGALRRGLDIIVASAALVFLLPLFCVLGLAIFIQDGGPVFYGQERVGRGGRSFRCWKFRSMVVDAGARLQTLLATSPAARAEWERDHKLKCDPRITVLGSFLRRSSLDELPQLLNILIGEMSVVGPRPIVAAEVVRYGARFRHYCRVKPGLTGLWQVSGRNDTSYSRRVALDTVYVRNQSAALNIKIILSTVPAIIFARGSY